MKFPEKTLEIAKKDMAAYIEEIQTLTRDQPDPAAWGMAAQYAKNIAHACEVVERELAEYHKPFSGNDAMRAIAADTFTDEPVPSVHPVFAPLLAAMRLPEAR